MKRHDRIMHGRIATDGGFTFFELMIVLVMMAVLFAIALPAVIDWRKNSYYRQAAKQMASMLGEARELAIVTNFQHMVVFKPNSSSCKILKGTQSYNSSSYPTVVSSLNPPKEAIIRTNSSGTSTANVYVQFNPNGTAKFFAPSGAASDSNVSVNNGAAQKYLISIAPTGRVTLQKK